ncbi:NB-ARC domain-containing protein [Bradyrhizobium sp. B124]|uniref:NB-ARC domain-containing protein n=1 Tax=Bradyrhizobium sp. B124 TaxID=3140245 RepID=UPI0031844137
MNETLRNLFVKRLIENIEVIAPGPRFERFGAVFLDYYLQIPLGHRGLNALGSPVGYTVDTVSDQGDIAAEYTIDKTYFEGTMDKAWGDFEHARKKHPNAKHIFLLCTETAGPKRYSETVQQAGEYKRQHAVDIHFYDGRRIAEVIIDHLMMNDTAIDRLAEFLPMLKQIRDEHEASHLVPDPGSGYVPRSVVETAITDQLAQSSCVVVSGFGGTGKSQCAAAIAGAQRQRYDLIIWHDASQLERLEQLQSLPVARSGVSRNVSALLRTLRCLLVLDDVRFGFDRANVAALWGPGSKVLITTRQVEPGAYQMPPLEQHAASDMLGLGIGGGCPANVFDIVWSTVGGHPLTLRLMNAAVQDGTASWQDLVEDCRSVAELVDDRQERIADRILKRLMPALSHELSLFAWAGQPSCDRGFARYAIQPLGLRKLQNYCLTTPDAGASVRLHDIVYACLSSTPEVLGDARRSELDDSFDAYIGSVYHLDLELVAVRHSMKKTLERLVRGGDRRPALLYGLITAWDPSEVDPALIGDVDAYVKGLDSGLPPKPIAVSVALEAMETLYRYEKSTVGIDTAKTNLRAELPIFDKLADIGGLAEQSEVEIQHHRGKALNIVGDSAEAVKVFESVMAGPSPLQATRLQLLRIYAKGKQQPDRVHALVEEILSAAQRDPQDVASSILLGSIESMAGAVPFDRQTQIYTDYGDMIEERILTAAAAGAEQAYQAFAVVGRYWAWNEPARFKSVFNSLPRRSVADATRDYDRSAYGEVLLEAGGVMDLSPEERKQALDDSLKFYEAIEKPSPFQLRKTGEILVKAERWSYAEATLEALDAKQEPWRGYWLAKARLGGGKAQDALADINVAVAKLDASSQYWSTFMALRHEIREATDAIKDLREAAATCTNTRYKAILEKRLAAAEADRSAPEMVRATRH